MPLVKRVLVEPQPYTLNSLSKKVLNNAISNILYYGSIVLIVLLSYFTVSTGYSGYFDSDNAVPILQANNFQFSSDLYYWGQQRLGSFTPLVANFVHRFFHLPTLTSISIVNYAVLLGLFFVFASFLKNRLLKIALAIVIFLPAIKFKYILLLGHPYSVQLLLIGLVYLILQKLKSINRVNGRIGYISGLLSLSVLLSFLSIWLSEYSLVFLGYIYGSFFLAKYDEGKQLPLFSLMVLVLAIIIPSFFGGCFIWYAKYTTIGNAYGGFPIFIEFEQLIRIINQYGLIVIKKYFFTTEYIFYSIPMLLFLVVGIISVKSIYKESKDFLLLFALAIFPAIILYWVASNGWAGRYFTPAYFFLWMAILKTADQKREWHQFSSIGIIIVVILQSYPIVKFEFETPSEVNRLKAFSVLGECGIVGDYWSSYNIAAANIDSIKATPHERSCRNFILANQVVRKNNVYLIVDNWLEDIPETVQLFDVMLVRTNQSKQEIRGLTVVKYHSIPQ